MYVPIACKDETDDAANRNTAVKKHAKLTADLSRANENLLNKETHSGEQFYKIDFDIEMALHSASLTFTLGDLGLGMAQQTVQVEFV